MRKTKIVCTIGPASESVEILMELIKAGMNVARLNFSHGNHEEHSARIRNIRQAAKRLGKTVAILLDTKGPEIRTHTMENGEVHLEAGKEVVISMTEVVGNANKFSVTYSGLVNDIEIGSKILLDDGLIELEVIEIGNGEIRTKIINSGVLKNKKGVNVPNVSIKLPAMTEKDIQDIQFGIRQKVDFIAVSFVRKAQDVFEIRKLLEKNKCSCIQIIPKIENQQGVENVDEILEISDGLMVARGDLGVEIPAEEVPLVQKVLIKKCNMAGKPVITATQMLDSMQRNPRPTRAEASDVANAIFDGTDAIMLSGETAAGQYPVEAVHTMHQIAFKTETALSYRDLLTNQSRNSEITITDAISRSVAHTALNLNAKAIITPTESGSTAQSISKYRPMAPIIAVTPSHSISRKLALVWGVFTKVGKQTTTIDEMLDNAVQDALEEGLVSHGDLVVITAGVPVGTPGTTNLMKVHIIGDIIAKGQGIGRKSATGEVVIIKTPQDAMSKINEGSIIVTISTDRDMMPYLEKAAAIITEEGGLTSHGAVIGLSLGIPVIAGVTDATTILKEKQEITVDAARGDIYDGRASVI